MKPVSPVIKGFEQFEILLAKDQPEYLPIPTLVAHSGDMSGERRFMSRWEFSEEERELIARGGSLWFQQLVFSDECGKEGLFNPVCFAVQLMDEAG